MLHVKGNLHILILLCSAYYICVCVVNPIVSKMSDIISTKINISKIKVSNLSSFNYCDTLSTMCFTNMYSVFQIAMIYIWRSEGYMTLIHWIHLSCYCKTDTGPALLTLSRFVFYYS